jgi:hypothetical protein
MSFKVIWAEPRLEPLRPVEPTRQDRPQLALVQPPEPVDKPADTFEPQQGLADAPETLGYLDVLSLRRRHAMVQASRFRSEIPLLERRLAFAQWCNPRVLRRTPV